MKGGMREIGEWLLECVFPHFCLGCGLNDVYFCANCRQAPWFTQPPGIFETTTPDLDSVTSLVQYKTSHTSARLMEDFKYFFINEAKKEVGEWLKNAAWLKEKLPVVDNIVPVPLHYRRLAERGYNQAEIVARYLGDIIKKPTNTSILARSRATKQQAKLTRDERMKNVVAAFACVDKKILPGKRILVVDDVYTTGSTMRECAKTLLANGAVSVSGFTLARG